MKRLPEIKTMTNSVQLKFAATFLVLIAVLAVFMNTYPTIAARDLVFSSKKASLQNQAGVMASALSAPEELTSDTVPAVMLSAPIRKTGLSIRLGHKPTERETFLGVSFSTY